MVTATKLGVSLIFIADGRVENIEQLLSEVQVEVFVLHSASLYLCLVKLEAGLLSKDGHQIVPQGEAICRRHASVDLSVWVSKGVLPPGVRVRAVLQLNLAASFVHLLVVVVPSLRRNLEVLLVPLRHFVPLFVVFCLHRFARRVLPKVKHVATIAVVVVDEFHGRELAALPGVVLARERDSLRRHIHLEVLLHYLPLHPLDRPSRILGGLANGFAWSPINAGCTAVRILVVLVAVQRTVGPAALVAHSLFFILLHP